MVYLLKCSMTEKKQFYNLQPSRSGIVHSYSEEDTELLLDSQSDPKRETNYLKIFIVLSAIVGIFLSGFVSHKLLLSFTMPEVSHKIANIREVISAKNIKTRLQDLSSETHIAGSGRNYKIAQALQLDFIKYKFDNVEMKNYSIKLPYPDPENPNSVNLLDDSGNIIHKCAPNETPLTKFEKSHPTTVLFNAWSKTGTVKAPYVYVNFATDEDFKMLKSKNISVTGKIALARYGSLFRGDQAAHAVKAGAVAVVLFKDYNIPDIEQRYPEGELAPKSASQRGTVRQGAGDPQTQGWPSAKGGYRDSKAPMLIPIIVHPITAADAEVLLNKLKPNSGLTTPDGWKGGLDAAYNIGTGSGPTLQVTVHSVMREVNATNVIGTILGKEEPDRWVMVGNHRDAWTYGGADPGSGTAVMMEVAQSLSHYLEMGWRPRRTVKFVSWGAEEWGLIGSTEWVEEYRSLLSTRGVVYINIDIAYGGTCSTLQASGSPMYHSLIRRVLYDNPIPGFAPAVTNLTSPSPSANAELIELTGAGSDYSPFSNYVGVSVVDLSCPGTLDLYHTMYDNMRLFELTDPEFKAVATVAKAVAELAVGISEPAILPINIIDYSNAVSYWWSLLRKQYSEVFVALGVTEGLTQLTEQISSFGQSAHQFTEHSFKTANVETPLLRIRAINDRLIQTERMFIVQERVRGGDFYFRNVLSSPSAANSYEGKGFPGLSNALSSTNATRDDVLRELERVKWAFIAARHNLIEA